MTLNIGSTPYLNYSSQVPVNNKKVYLKSNLEKEKSSTTKKVIGGFWIFYVSLSKFSIMNISKIIKRGKWKA